jgi:hypothetical protein
MPIFFTQKVNQWLCLALVCLMAFWVVLYYFVHKAEAIGNQYSSSRSALLE